MAIHVYTLRLRLLNHLFYHTENTNGVYTGPFIGDLALTYAFRRTLVAQWELPPPRKKPHYEEIKDWGFYASVAQPESHEFTEVYTRNTLFNVDGYIDTDAITKSSKSPFKNLYYTQGIAAGSVFTCQLYSKTPLEIPAMIRVGTGKETMVLVENIDESPKDICLNIFTQKNIFQNLDLVADLVQSENYERAYVLEQYVLLKHISPKVATAIMEDSLGKS